MPTSQKKARALWTTIYAGIPILLPLWGCPPSSQNPPHDNIFDAGGVLPVDGNHTDAGHGIGIPDGDGGIVEIPADDPLAYCRSEDESNPQFFAPRALRLLTRDEYRRSVRYLLQLDTIGTRNPADDVEPNPVAPVDPSADPSADCHHVVFRFDPAGNGAGANRMHVAGSFNNWPAQYNQGLAMQYDAAAGIWQAETTLDNGEYQYKFVIDENQWIEDPTASSFISDGFGGRNSVLRINCPAQNDGGVNSGANSGANNGANNADNNAGPNAGLNADFAVLRADPARFLPPDGKPARFPFASFSAGGLVTSLHIEEYLHAAEVLTESIDVMALVPCQPQNNNNNNNGNNDANCADQFLQTWGRRTFRRPLTDAERNQYRTALLAEANAKNSFADGVRLVMQAMLISPTFLYRAEIGDRPDLVQNPDALQGSNLDGYERAAALSFFLTGTTPDDNLLDQAAQGLLNTDAGMRTAAASLLAQSNSSEALGTFAAQWLDVERVLTVDKNTNFAQILTDVLRQDLLDETKADFVRAVLSGSFDDLWTSQQTYASRAVASFYGVDTGGQPYALVDLPPERSGVLGHASFLASQAHSDQTNPVRRGLWVRERLLCQHLGTPPANAGAIPDVDPNATTRERFRQHSSDPSCYACHQYIDSVGFGFEEFDAVGRYRTSENGLSIDHSGDMNDLAFLGSNTHAPFSSSRELGALLQQSNAPKACFVQQVARYAQGRELELLDACALTSATTRFFQTGSMREVLLDVVTAPAFTQRR